MPLLKFTCWSCKKPFDYNPKPAAEDARATDAETSVIVNCQYCSEENVINVPRDQVAQDTVLRGMPHDGGRNG